jgi:hypothetical protein
MREQGVSVSEEPKKETTTPETFFAGEEGKISSSRINAIE